MVECRYGPDPLIDRPLRHVHYVAEAAFGSAASSSFDRDMCFRCRCLSQRGLFGIGPSGLNTVSIIGKKNTIPISQSTAVCHHSWPVPGMTPVCQNVINASVVVLLRWGCHDYKIRVEWQSRARANRTPSTAIISAGPGP